MPSDVETISNMIYQTLNIHLLSLFQASVLHVVMSSRERMMRAKRWGTCTTHRASPAVPAVARCVVKHSTTSTARSTVRKTISYVYIFTPCFSKMYIYSGNVSLIHLHTFTHWKLYKFSTSIQDIHTFNTISRV